MKFKNKVIVVGANHSNTLGVVRSLGEQGVRSICILHGNEKGLVFDSKYPLECVYKKDIKECFQYVNSHFSSEKYKPIIFPCEDTASSIFDLNYNLLKDRFFLHNACEQGRITHFMDKETIGALSRKYGFKTPKSWLYSKEENDISKVEYPCFVKADKTINGGKKPVAICHNKQELQFFLKSLPFKNLLIQQYVEKKDELCCQGFSINKGNDIYIPFHERFLHFTSKSFGGYVVLKKNTDKERDLKIKLMLQEIEYTGLFSAEFLIDKSGEYYFTEINLRHDGFSYFTTTGGANLPYLFYRSLMQGYIDLSDVKLKDKIVGINEMYHYGKSVKTGDISLVKFLRQFITADSYILFNIKDLKPLFSLFTGKLKSVIYNKL